MNAMLRPTGLVTLAVAALSPVTALAHPGHGVGEHFVAGVLHPLSGLDHVLMIVAVSAWAALLKPAGRIVVAGCLALFVALGALLPWAPAPGAALEAAIASTVIGAGVLLAIGRRWPVWATGAVAAVFALIHGFAHGAEGPSGSLAYVPGLALATGTMAVVVSWLAARLQSHGPWLRSAGAVGAVMGVAALVTV